MPRVRLIERLDAGCRAGCRFILDYLFEQVLNTQPAVVQRFLLQTAILERLTAPLCDAVVQEEGPPEPPFVDAQSILEYLERANLFIVPLCCLGRAVRWAGSTRDATPHCKMILCGGPVGATPR